MRRRLLAAGIGGVTIALVLLIIFLGRGLAVPGRTALPTATPQPPVSTPTKPVSHVKVKLAHDYKAFVRRVCSAFQRRDISAIQNDLMYYQLHTEVYWSPFDLSGGQPGGISLINTWMSSSHAHCTRLSPSFQQHAVLVTAGWNLDGGWGIIDLDKQGGWSIDDFTFGTKRQVLGAFYGNERVSVAYRSIA